MSGYSSVDDISITQETKIVKKKKVIKKLIVAKFCTGAGYQRDSSFLRQFSAGINRERLSPVTGAAFPASVRAPISCQSLRLALTGSNMKLCGSS